MSHCTLATVKKRSGRIRMVFWPQVTLLFLLLCPSCQQTTLAPSSSSKVSTPTPRPLQTSFSCGTLSDKQCAFTWFDILGYPDLQSLPYIRVATGRWLQIGDQAPENDYIRAFLLADEKNTFTVSTTKLVSLTFTKTAPGVKEYERVGYEVLDIRTDVVAYLEERVQQQWQGRVRWPDQQLDVRAEILVIARACAANGLDDLANQLYTLATAQVDPHIGGVDPRPLYQVAADEIAYATIWRNTVAFGDPRIPRQELVSSFEQIHLEFPKE